MGVAALVLEPITGPLVFPEQVPATGSIAVSFCFCLPKMIQFIREFKLHLFSSANGSYNHVILYDSKVKKVKQNTFL